ncbi:MAG: hypothetical protein GY939_15105 [Actinomycetia bacterium]|nr:hypothetical protein [Actinomycetes bacterium]
MTNGSVPMSLGLEGLGETLVLERIEVYNWGPFARHHTAEIDPRGTSIIGPTGSGKTTLVDALMTLIVALPKYNLASTGGHDSDRDLMSYVRGVVGHGNESGDVRHIARPGRTVTGLAATFARPGRSVTLAAILWTDGTSMSANDCKKRWLIYEGNEESLEQWLIIHHDGGARALKDHCSNRPRLHIEEAKRSYLARVRRLFDIGENAFDLLNRAAGLKQLDSVDQIFRDLVLDDSSGFRRAAEVANEFDQLAGIRAELEIARRQQRSLQPLVALNDDHQRVTAEREEQVKLKAIVATWFALAGARLWGAQVGQFDKQLAALEVDLAEGADRVVALEEAAETLRLAYLRLGGSDLDALDDQIASQEQTMADRQRDYDDYVQLVNQLRISVDLNVDEPGADPTREGVEAVHQAIGRLRPRLEQQIEEREAQFQAAASAVGTADEEARACREERDRIAARPDSNIPGRYQDFRSDLADAVGLSDADLPFAAEMVSVSAGQESWRGAIERAIGAHRLRILVPGERLDEGLAWVNHRDNRLHVRLEAVRAATGAGSREVREPFVDSFLHKLDLKDHPYWATLWGLLVSIDRHCVGSAEALRSVEHGMTAQGLLSGRTGRFEKRDQEPLTQGWVTGFDNKARLAELSARLDELDRLLERARADYEQPRRERDGFVQGVQLLDRVEGFIFDRLDLVAARGRLQTLIERRCRLINPGSETAKAKDELDAAHGALGEARQAQTMVSAEIKVQNDRRLRADDQRRRAAQRAGTGLTADDAELAEERLPALDGIEPDELPAEERSLAAEVDERIGTLQERLEDLGLRLTRQMGQAKKEDTGELIEAGEELADLPAYLERLQVLTEESLPKRQQKFVEYLNLSSDQGVSSLLETIEAEVDAIVGRIRDLNMTLQKVDFQPGRYLELQPNRVTHQALRDLQRARKALAAARLTDDQGEAQYAALKQVIGLLRQAADNRATVAARALLDPRHRLTFKVAVIDRATAETIEVRSSSEGGSGGEKEIIASYILTASLSYALSPGGAPQPLFGTIVLDEAFSKSSQTVAARIIEALAVFGLHPLFVTPNKELSLLRANTHSAILVNRRGLEAKLTALSWEELDKKRPGSAPIEEDESIIVLDGARSAAAGIGPLQPVVER